MFAAMMRKLMYPAGKDAIACPGKGGNVGGKYMMEAARQMLIEQGRTPYLTLPYLTLLEPVVSGSALELFTADRCEPGPELTFKNLKRHELELV